MIEPDPLIPRSLERDVIPLLREIGRDLTHSGEYAKIAIEKARRVVKDLVDSVIGVDFSKY